jgi:hypothetical protein
LADPPEMIVVRLHLLGPLQGLDRLVTGPAAGGNLARHLNEQQPG